MASQESVDSVYLNYESNAIRVLLPDFLSEVSPWTMTTPDMYTNDGWAGNEVAESSEVPPPAAFSLPIDQFPLTPYGFCCPICNRTFQRRGRLDAHLNSHSRNKPYVCGGKCGVMDCRAAYGSDAGLRRHCRSVEQRRRTCDQCGKQILRQNIARHVARHNDERLRKSS